MREIVTKSEMARRARKRRARNIRRCFVGLALSVIILGAAMTVYNSENASAVSRVDRDGLHKYYTEVVVRRNDTLRSIAESTGLLGYESTEELVKEIMQINYGSIGQPSYGDKIIVPYYSSECK